MKDSCFELIFNIIDRVGGNSRYVDGDPIRLTNSNGKEKEEMDNVHINSLMQKLISSSRGGDDLSIGFHRIVEVRER